MAYKLTKKDKSVLMAFSDKESASSKKLSTDGKVLEKIGMGGDAIAQWKGGKIVVASDMPQVKSDEVIIRALEKIVPKNQLKNESKNYGDSLLDDMRSILEDVDRLSGLPKMESKTWDDKQEIDIEISDCKNLIYSDVNKNLERVSNLLMSIRSKIRKGYYKEEEIGLLKKNVITASEAIEVAQVFILGAKELLQGSVFNNIQKSQGDRKWIEKMIDKVS